MVKLDKFNPLNALTFCKQFTIRIIFTAKNYRLSYISAKFANKNYWLQKNKR